MVEFNRMSRFRAEVDRCRADVDANFVHFDRGKHDFNQNPPGFGLNLGDVDFSPIWTTSACIPRRYLSRRDDRLAHLRAHNVGAPPAAEISSDSASQSSDIARESVQPEIVDAAETDVAVPSGSGPPARRVDRTPLGTTTSGSATSKSSSCSDERPRWLGHQPPDAEPTGIGVFCAPPLTESVSRPCHSGDLVDSAAQDRPEVGVLAAGARYRLHSSSARPNLAVCLRPAPIGPPLRREPGADPRRADNAAL